MAQIVLEGLQGTAATEDGAYGLFKFSSGAGENPVAVPFDDLPLVISGAAQALHECHTNKGSPVDLKQVFDVEWWNFRAAEDGNLVVLSFQIPGGAPLAFAVHQDRLDQMIAALESLRQA